jgi:hypothetical protein
MKLDSKPKQAGKFLCYVYDIRNSLLKLKKRCLEVHFLCLFDDEPACSLLLVRSNSSSGMSSKELALAFFPLPLGFEYLSNMLAIASPRRELLLRIICCRRSFDAAADCARALTFCGFAALAFNRSKLLRYFSSYLVKFPDESALLIIAAILS